MEKLDFNFIEGENGIDINDAFNNIDITKDMDEESESSVSDDNEPDEEDMESFDLGGSEEDEDAKESKTSESNNEENTSSSSKAEESPMQNILSSFAKAMLEEGVFSDIENVDEITTAEQLKEVIEKMIEDKSNQRFDDKQKRLLEAMDIDPDISDIKAIMDERKKFDGLSDDILETEGEQYDNLRRNIIGYYMSVVLGYSNDRVNKEVNKSIKAGTEIEDALDAYHEIINSLDSKYESALSEKKRKKSEEENNRIASFQQLYKSIEEDDNIFGELDIDKKTRRKILDVLQTEVGKDKKGRGRTAIQAYMDNNPIEFNKYVALTYVLTDGFTKIGNLMKAGAKKQVKSALKDFEDKLNGTSRDVNGSFRFVSGSKDSQSYIRAKENNWNVFK